MNPTVSSRPEYDQDLVELLWSFGGALREDGISGLEYVEQLSCLILLKRVHEQRHRPLNSQDVLGYDAWGQLLSAARDRQFLVYEQTLVRLASRPGTLGLLFRRAQNRIPEPTNLHRMIDLVDRRHWSGGDSGAIFEALLARLSADQKTGAGQYFTPRPLIETIVQCVQPGIDDTITDPACGTGGFLIKAFEYLIDHFPSGVTSAQRARLNADAFFGTELVDATARLATTNLVLHGVTQADAANPCVTVGDALADPAVRRATLVLTSPPFGRRSTSEAPYREDFWTGTTSRQLNFLQHVYTLLETDGRAAVVVPDSVLFEGGAGELIRRRLLTACDVHTLLRLPTGIFYAGGLKASILFFDKPDPRPDGSPSTKRLWVYDLRSQHAAPAKITALTGADYGDFVSAYRPGRPRSERVETPHFRSFTVEEVLARHGANLDLQVAEPPAEPFMLDEPESDLHRMAEEVTAELRAALAEFAALTEALRPYGVHGGGPDPEAEQ
ncbi:N-6 DNA methylase [Streptomyces sp. 110]|uniref:site-specific DNA-methyltransferase (adenine-specific) n=1 Tax=Streptomyces endocoffeicus TaxID=2898945 RepID=A0ABS1Q6A3_9ACTN|nr:N-6 DNA methylase [Streptomyces endocoffeicus]MBL1120203.1 N-6 DNA methylase [Streptomyces endocoffeicus]